MTKLVATVFSSLTLNVVITSSTTTNHSLSCYICSDTAQVAEQKCQGMAIFCAANNCKSWEFEYSISISNNRMGGKSLKNGTSQVGSKGWD